MSKQLATYCASLTVVAIALALGVALYPMLDLPFLVMLVAIVFAAWIGGKGPAIAALIAGAIGIAYFVLEPRFSFAVSAREYQFGLAIYFLVGLATILMIESVRKAKLRSDDVSQGLRTSLDTLRAFYDNSPLCMGVTELADGDIRHVYDNDASARFFGFASGATANKYAIADLNANPQIVKFWLDRYTESQLSGQPVHFEHELQTLDGTRWLSATVCPITTGAAERHRFCYLAEDITSRKALEDSLKRSHDTFYRLIQNNPFGIYLVNADFVLTQISLGAQKVFASVSPPALGRDFAEVLRAIWCEPFATDAINIFRHTLNTGEPYVAPSTIERRADVDSVEAYDWRIERINLPDGRLGVVCYFYDLTERQSWERALSESEERLRLATDASGLGIWSWQPNDDVVVWENERPYQIMNIPLNEPPISAARFAAEFVHSEDLPEFEQSMQRTIHQGANFQFEGRARRSDGKEIWVEFRGKPVVGIQPLRVIGTVQDVTNRKSAELLLRDSDRRKDEFLATLAHELRNPLAPVKNSLELLKQVDANPHLLEQARSTMERQIGQMVRLIDDLLDVSRITSGKLELKVHPVELATIVNDAVETCRPHCDRAGHQLDVSLPAEPVFLNADSTRLGQVLGNLLTNAFKYTQRGGHIRLTAELSQSDVVISIEDDGIGIPEDMIGKVFDLFTQVDRSLERAAGGLGIGLSLVKRLVEMHNGSVSAYSQGQDKGSKFVVRLPVLATSVGQQAISATVPTEAASRMNCLRFLIVDDNKDAAITLAMLLRMSGNETLCAHDGEEAIEKAEIFKPNVILLDIGLPKKNGYEVCRAIKREDWGSHIRILALTGWGQEEDRRKSKEAGFDGHLVKPVDHSRLLSMLADAPKTIP